MLPLKNKCFALLPKYIRTAVRPHLMLTEVPKAITLASLAREPTVYFPINCVLAITATATDQKGAFLRFACTGVAIGLQPDESCEPVRSEAVVCRAGYLFSIPSAVVWDLLASPSVLEASYMNLVRAIASRALICSFCTANHSISQRLATLLLSAEDEFGRGSEISLSQSEIADLMFVRRESIASFLADWSGRGVIATGRSKIVINDREYLQFNGCPCYQSAASQVSREFDSWASLRWKEEPAVKNIMARYAAAKRVGCAALA